MTPPRTPSPARVARWLVDQRWYGGGADDAAEVATVARIEVAAGVWVAVVEDQRGERYQLVQRDAQPDRADQPKVAAALVSFVAAQESVGGAGGTIRGRWSGPPPGRAGARPLGTEQSNTSVTVGGTHLLKVLRHLRPGDHPEVEVGLHLRGTEAPVPDLAGWWELEDDDGRRWVLGTVHELVVGALDGWALTLGALAADPGAHLARLHELGAAIASLPGALARPGDGFGAQPADPHATWALGDRLLTHPELPAAGHHLVARAVQQVGSDVGAALRGHGDLHLGQVLHTAAGWQVIDFEGEPDRTLEERRAPASPLRDVAGMLRSLSYAVAAHQRAEGPPLASGWLRAARASLLDGYLAAVDPALLPASAAATQALLQLHELEKVLYEVSYELGHRPDWVAIPRAGLAQLLGEAP